MRFISFSFAKLKVHCIMLYRKLGSGLRNIVFNFIILQLDVLLFKVWDQSDSDILIFKVSNTYDIISYTIYFFLFFYQ